MLRVVAPRQGARLATPTARHHPLLVLSPPQMTSTSRPTLHPPTPNATPTPASQLFSTSATSHAAKKAAAKPAQKKKVAVKKKSGGLSGPRGGGGKRKGGGEAAGLSRANPFAASPVDVVAALRLNPFQPEHCSPANVGSALGWTKSSLDLFRAVGTPKSWARELATHHAPYTVLRPHSLELLNSIESSTPTSHLVVGARGSGKSTLLLQAVAFACDSADLVPLYVPSCVSLVNSTSPYAYSASQRTYLQPQATDALLRSLARTSSLAAGGGAGVGGKLRGVRADLGLLGGGRASLEPGVLPGRGASADSLTLADLLRHALDASTTPAARQQLLELILLQLARVGGSGGAGAGAGGVASTPTPRLVLVLDDVQALFRASWYRDPDYAALQAYELAVPRLLLTLLRMGTGGGGGADGDAADGGSCTAHRLAAVGTSATEWATPTELRNAVEERRHLDAAPQADAGGAAGGWRPSNYYERLHEVHARHAREYLATMAAATAAPGSGSGGTVAAAASRGGVVEVGGLEVDEARSLFEARKEEKGMWSAPTDETFLQRFIASGGNAAKFTRSLVGSML